MTEHVPQLPPLPPGNRYTLRDMPEPEAPPPTPLLDEYHQKRQAYAEAQQAKAAAELAEYNAAMAEVDAQPWNELCRPAFTPEDVQAAVPQMSGASHTWIQAEFLRRDMERSMTLAAQREGREQPRVTARIVPNAPPELKDMLANSPVRYATKASDLDPNNPHLLQIARDYYNGEVEPQKPTEHTPIDMTDQRVVAYATLSGGERMPGYRGSAYATYDFVFTTPVEQTPPPSTYF